MSVLGRLLAVLPAAALPIALLVGPASPVSATPPPDPATFPAGDPPAVTWQSGTTVHTRAGRTIRLPLKADPSAVRVLGRRHGEWIVVIEGGEPRVVGVKGRKVRQIWFHEYDESATSYYLGDDFVLEENFTRGGDSYDTPFDLRGRAFKTRGFNYGYVIGVEGTEIFYTRQHQSFSWVPGEKPAVVGPAASLADPERDVLFVDDTDPDVETVGPTALSAPATPPWTADFSPVAISPDGGWVAGAYYVGRSYRLQVRKLADGSPAGVPELKVESDAAFAWEPDGSLLVEVEGKLGHALVRCALAGQCERATPWTKGQQLTFPS